MYGGIFDKIDPGGYEERRSEQSVSSLEVLLVKRLITSVCPAQKAQRLLKSAADDSPNGKADFAWLYSRFSAFPCHMLAHTRLQTSWHLEELMGNKFARHKFVATYFEAAKKLGINTKEEPFALLARVNFSSTVIFTMHNLDVAAQTKINVETFPGKGAFNTRLIRWHDDKLYCIEDHASFFALLGTTWADD